MKWINKIFKKKETPHEMFNRFIKRKEGHFKFWASPNQIEISDAIFTLLRSIGDEDKNFYVINKKDNVLEIWVNGKKICKIILEE